MIVDSIAELCAPSMFLRLNEVFYGTVHLKIEGLNVAGSIKLKTARQILGDLERSGVLKPGMKIIESSSGNLGIALAHLCAERGYPFTCVSDPNLAPAARRLITAIGGRVIVVTERDDANGYLKTRLNLIRRMVAEDPMLIWTNQYANPSNCRAHYLTTGPEILETFAAPDWVFIGAGTTGTLAGTARYLREHSPLTRIVAVDTVGSVTFGKPAGVRHFPGLGTSRRPEIADECSVDRLVMVHERDALEMCLRIAKMRGLTIGPSTGSVLAAVATLASELSPHDVVVAVSPDLGDRYLETAYDHAWIAERFPCKEELSRQEWPATL